MLEYLQKKKKIKENKRERDQKLTAQAKRGNWEIRDKH